MELNPTGDRYGGTGGAGGGGGDSGQNRMANNKSAVGPTSSLPRPGPGPAYGSPSGPGGSRYSSPMLRPTPDQNFPNRPPLYHRRWTGPHGGGNSKFHHYRFNRPLYRYSHPPLPNPNLPPPNFGPRKRPMDDEGAGGSSSPKKRYTPYDRASSNFHSQAPHVPHNSAQNRLSKIRNSFANDRELDDPVVEDPVGPKDPEDDGLDTFEIQNDAADDDPDDSLITVEVFNPAALNDFDNIPGRFKLDLDPKLQASIRKIQSKNKEKQLVIPFRCMPTCTTRSMHERFSML